MLRIKSKIKLSAVLFILFTIALLHSQPNAFIGQQKKYSRVRRAFSEKDSSARRLFKEAGVSYPPHKIFLRVFKSERLIELWAATPADTFKLITTYPFCSSSGTLGPKRQQGDLQIPEGFYYIQKFNPVSDYFLSLGINYPNASDRILGVKGRLGGDIFIHGDCVTIGCIPITDDKIKELYIIAVQAHGNGQEKIPVHIFPARLTEDVFTDLKNAYGDHAELINFWGNLKTGFDLFERQHQLPQVLVDRKTGGYIFK